MSGAKATTCPDCGTTNDPDNTFCEVCGLNFATGERPAPPPAPAPLPATPPPSRNGGATPRPGPSPASREGGAAAGEPDPAPRPDPGLTTANQSPSPSPTVTGTPTATGSSAPGPRRPTPTTPDPAPTATIATSIEEVAEIAQVAEIDEVAELAEIEDGAVAGRSSADRRRGVATAWIAVIQVDAEFFASNQAADHAGELALPTSHSSRHVQMVGDDLLIGRRSTSRRISPAIDLSVAPQDTGVSHRHATLSRRGEGWSVTDLGSTNGSWVAGDPDALEPFVEQPIRDGDSLLIGAWTRITLRVVDETGTGTETGTETETKTETKTGTATETGTGTDRDGETSAP